MLLVDFQVWGCKNVFRHDLIKSGGIIFGGGDFLRVYSN